MCPLWYVKGKQENSRGIQWMVIMESLGWWLYVHHHYLYQNALAKTVHRGHILSVQVSFKFNLPEFALGQFHMWS